MLFFLILSLVILITILTGVLMTRSRQVKQWAFAGLLTIAVGGGFFFYSYGYLSSGAGLADRLLVALRGIIRTARMFSLNNDYGELVNEQGAYWLKDYLLPQIVFWLCHISALVIVQAALLSLFGRKLIDWIRLHFGFHREVYLIKGSDKYALMLGENIATHDNPQQPPDKKRLVLFLVDDDDKKIQEKAAHFGGIIKVLDRKNNLSACLKESGLGKDRLRGKKRHVIFTQNDASVPNDVRLLAKFAKGSGVKPENLDMYVLSSSEWDREKIEAITLAKEGERRKYPYTIHIIDEADVLVRRMIEERPPYECPGLGFNETNKTGIAARNFTVMILGFGTVGQRALLRLIMNGQFLGSAMRAIVVDREIEHLRDHFLHRYPSLDMCCKIDFKNFDVRDKAFFELLKETADIDYIVAALSNDDISKQTALDIRLYYERKNINLPFIAVYEEDGGSYDTKYNERVFSSGGREAVYKEAVIIREQTDRMARVVHEGYKRTNGERTPWNELDWFTQESNRVAADFIPAMLTLAGIKENDSNGENTLSENKELAENLSITEHLRWNAFHAAMGYSPMSIEEMRQRFEKYGLECRKDQKNRLHVCLAPWDELDKISAACNELVYQADKESKVDFKENDRERIKNLPKFLNAVEARKNWVTAKAGIAGLQHDG